ncbi:FbpB family small basic protein [Bacillus carboniphilus]|uniref:FbpB family small basic protein n=1 Tax=Bacillus carboniphilus TaxID=86663 RepID=A0ABY9JXB4_9BACI|nr:FbpB family small basic protein [Bacillus carboniphilus]WLR43439.1 FbpB family small basic protein [Bacillus carboniphilus]
MRKQRKVSFEELVSENKQQLLNDNKALDAIEDRLEEKIREQFKEKSS